MVTLFVDDLDQITILECVLISKSIDYELALNEFKHGLSSPYLLVYGAVLNETRAIKWALGDT